MRKLIFVGLVAGLAILLAACGSSQSAQPSPTRAPVTISMTTDPAEPMMGDLTVKFAVVDQQGQPITGADFDVIADHTDMSGMTMHGKATEQSNGLYAITANFSMAGNWKLTVQVRKDALNYRQDIDLVVK